EEDLRSRRAGAAGSPGDRVRRPGRGRYRQRRRDHHDHAGHRLQPGPGHRRCLYRCRPGDHGCRDGHRPDRWVGHRGDRPPARGRPPHLHHHDHRGRPDRGCHAVRARDLPDPEPGRP
ncbi:MAG: ATP synthase F0 sector subunit c, partial [uncultured Phycisphaerae bacterium]